MCGLVLVTSGNALRNVASVLHETFPSHVVVEDRHLGTNTGIQPQTKGIQHRGLIPSAGGSKRAELASVIVNRLLFLSQELILHRFFGNTKKHP